jgi:hypothetical protein
MSNILDINLIYTLLGFTDPEKYGGIGSIDNYELKDEKNEIHKRHSGKLPFGIYSLVLKRIIPSPIPKKSLKKSKKSLKTKKSLKKSKKSPKKSLKNSKKSLNKSEKSPKRSVGKRK